MARLTNKLPQHKFVDFCAHGYSQVFCKPGHIYIMAYTLHTTHTTQSTCELTHKAIHHTKNTRAVSNDHLFTCGTFFICGGALFAEDGLGLPVFLANLIVKFIHSFLPHPVQLSHSAKYATEQCILLSSAPP